MALFRFHPASLRQPVLNHVQRRLCDKSTLQCWPEYGSRTASSSSQYNEGLFRRARSDGCFTFPYTRLARRGFAKKRLRLTEYEEYEQKLDPRRVPRAFVRVPIHHQSASELVETITTAGQLRLANPNFWRRCTTAVSDLACGLRVKELVNIVNAYAKAEVRDEQLFTLLARAIAAHVSECRASDIAVAVQAFARVNIRHYPLLNATAGEAAKRVHEMGPRGIAAMMWSFARLEVRHEGLVGEVCRELMENIGEYSSIDLTQTLWALGELRVTDAAVLTRICDHIMSHLTVYSVSELLLCAHALSKLLSFDHDLVPAMRSMFVQQLREIPLPQLPRLLHTFAAFDRIGTHGREPPTSPGLYRLIVTSILRNISFFRPKEIEQVRRSLATINLTDDLLDGVAYDVLPAKIRALPTEDLVSLLDFHSSAGSQEFSLLDDILVELYRPPETQQGNRNPGVTQEQSLRCLEALARMEYAQGVLYVLQSIIDDENRAGDLAHRGLYRGEEGKGLIQMDSPCLLVVQRLLLRMAPTINAFNSLRTRLSHQGFSGCPVPPPSGCPDDAVRNSVGHPRRAHADVAASCLNGLSPPRTRQGESRARSDWSSVEVSPSLSQGPLTSASYCEGSQREGGPTTAAYDACGAVSKDSSLSVDGRTEEVATCTAGGTKAREDTEKVITVWTAARGSASPRQPADGELFGKKENTSESSMLNDIVQGPAGVTESSPSPAGRQSVMRQRSPGKALFNYLAPGSSTARVAGSGRSGTPSSVENLLPSSGLSSEISRGLRRREETEGSTHTAPSVEWGKPQEEGSQNFWRAAFSHHTKSATSRRITVSPSHLLSSSSDLRHSVSYPDYADRPEDLRERNSGRCATSSPAKKMSTADCSQGCETSTTETAHADARYTSSAAGMKTREARTYISSKIPLNWKNILTRRFYERIAFAAERSAPSVLVAAIVRFPQDDARGLWWRELMNGKIEELEAELLPAVLLELGRVLDGTPRLFKSTPADAFRKNIEASLTPAVEDAQVYYGHVMALLFGEGRERERKGGHSVGGGPKLTPPKYKCLSKSALAVCVKTLELHPDRSEAAKHAATCVQWYLKRLSAANTEEHADGTDAQSDRGVGRLTSTNDSTLAAREATAKQMARMLHSLLALDVAPPQRLCVEIARRVNYIPLSDVFTVLRLFRVLGGVDQLAVSHLSLGLSTRRWEVKSWRKLRELEFLCKQLGVDLEDDCLAPDSKLARIKLGGGTIAEALDDGEDSESLGAVELPKDSDLPRLEAELGELQGSREDV